MSGRDLPTAARGRSLYARAGHLDEAALLRAHAARIDRVVRRVCAAAGVPEAADDLWSAGALGLLDAARRFDPARAVRFETFAEHRIRGAVLDELRRLDHLPRRLRDEIDRVRRVRDALAGALAREPDEGEVAAALGIEAGELAALAALAQPHLPLEDAALPPGDPPAADEGIARRQLAARLAAAVAALPERQQLVISLRYVEELTNREIARILGVSEPRVCQIHGDAIARLRAALDGA